MRSIIFDFDGTIGDSLKVIIEITNSLTKRNIQPTTEELERIRGMTIVQVAAELGIRRQQWPFLLFRGRRMMNKHIGEIKPFSEIDDVLKTLNSYGYKLYIMSSNSKNNIDTFLVEHGLSSYFESVHGGVGLFNKARALNKLILLNKLDRNESVYVGDEVRDIVAAAHAGIPCIAVSWGFNKPEVLAEHAPMVIVRTRPQLIKAIDSWAAS
jgi:HAD superfamily hydrolase (TIGR01549 family)